MCVVCVCVCVCVRACMCVCIYCISGLYPMGRKNLVNNLKVTAYAKHIFGVSVNIGEENFCK